MCMFTFPSTELSFVVLTTVEDQSSIFDDRKDLVNEHVLDTSTRIRGGQS